LVTASAPPRRSFACCRSASRPASRPGDARLTVPDFRPYEAEYTSATGRFFNVVRSFSLAGVPKISERA
jgi:hypothetical protein